VCVCVRVCVSVCVRACVNISMCLRVLVTSARIRGESRGKRLIKRSKKLRFLTGSCARSCVGAIVSVAPSLMLLE
jgi:hypothetical protein